MSVVDVVILIVIAALFAAAVWRIRKKGSCGDCCGSNGSGSCSSCSSDAKASCPASAGVDACVEHLSAGVGGSPANSSK